MKDLFQLLKKHNLTPNGYYLLYCLDNTEKIELPIPDKTEMHRLQLLGYLDEQYNITEKGKMMLIDIERFFIKKDKEPNKSDLELEFKHSVKKYIDIFPGGIVSGKALRGSISTILPRMNWFMKTYPEYTWDTIYVATRKYIESLDNMTYCKTAGYFIKKDDKNKTTTSLLADWCEAVNNMEEEERNNPALGFNKLA